MTPKPTRPVIELGRHKTRDAAPKPKRDATLAEYLKARGVSPSTADKLLISTETVETVANVLSIPDLVKHKVKDDGIGITSAAMIAYWNSDGTPRAPSDSRARLFGELPKDLGKFRQRAGHPAGNQLYMPPLLPNGLTWAEVMKDPAIPLWLTEGEIKAIRATLAGLVCAALGGVNNFRKRIDDEKSRLIDDLMGFIWEKRHVYIIFDADAAYNQHVARAATQLCKELWQLGARPCVVPLKRLPGKVNTGLDDFFEAHGSKQGRKLLDEAVAKAWSPYAPKSMTTDEIMRSSFDEDKGAYVVEGLIGKGLTLLVAAPKIGKSFCALQIANEVARGEKALGAFKTAKTDICYIALEDKPARIKRRLKTLNFGGLKNLEVFDQWAKGDHAYPQLARYLDEHPNTGLLIIDTWGKFRVPASKANMNAYERDYDEAAILKRIADEYGIAVLLIHHTRKASSLDVFESVSGSQGLPGAADTTIILKRTRNEEEGELHITSRDIPEQELAVRMDPDSCLWSVIGSAAERRAEGQKNYTIEAFRLAPGPVKLTDLSFQVNALRAQGGEKAITKVAVYNAVQRLVEAGMVKKVDGKAGLYEWEGSPITTSPTNHKY